MLRNYWINLTKREKIDFVCNVILVFLFGTAFLAKFIGSIVYDLTTTEYLIDGLFHSPTILSIFIHFTWWTTTIVFVSQLLILINRFINKENVVMRALTSRYILLAVAIYDLVVMSFVVVGAIATIANIGPESLRVFDQRDANGNPIAPSPLFFTVISSAVHFALPPLLIIYSLFHFKFYKNRFISPKFLLWVLLFPIVYMIFYFIFAKYAWDPYPITNLKENKGYSYLPVSLAGIEFISLILYFAFLKIKPYKQAYLDN